MKRYLLTLLILATFGLLSFGQTVYEDFEGGTADISWEGLNGTYDGVIANPDASGLNTSEFVGSYTNNPDFDFCFALGTLSAPADLSEFNVFKMKVWSPIAPIQMLLKFEGGGNAVEQFRDINTANQWVELTFDLSGGAAFTTLDKVLVSFNPFTLGSTETFYFDDLRSVEPVECYETFEGGNALPWTAIDGEFVGPVANPAPNIVNSSAECGRYVKAGDTGYSLLLAESTTPFDLSVFNQYKVQVYATAPTQVLLKLEGPGPDFEVTKNIAVTDAWQEYTFDLSAAAEVTDLNKMILFFDPDVEISQDTYYFDNICAVPQGACANVEPNPDMIDDFECNRNATYLNGWDSLSVIDNPDPGVVNPSAKVGQYIDPLGEPYGALVVDYQNPIDLSVKNQLKVKIWSPKICQILFKLEGGSSGIYEVWKDVPAANEWVEYEVDFSSQALANHKKIVFFFNAGQDGQPGDIYYIDDIQLVEQQELVVEDFEDGAFLPWAPLDDNTVQHGSFQVVDNPAPGGTNDSQKVGKYTKGSSPFSTVAAVAPGFIDISTRPQFNLDVWAPAGATSVIMQLESVSQGNKEVEREFQNPGNWENVSFDFSEFQSTTDWVALKLIFNPGTAEAGAMFFFDNLTQGFSTVDPCEGVVAITNIIDDFECQRNNEYGAGAGQLEVVNNPDVTTANSSTKVGLYRDPAGAPWEALCALFPEGIDLSVYNQLSIQVNAPAAVPVLLKLEGGSSPVSEFLVNITQPGEWETLTADFSSQVGMDHRRACFFFNAGVEPPTEDTYYIDNLQFAHAPYTDCLMSFDDPAFTSTEWRYFPNDDSGDFELVDNPDPSGINTSAKVGKAVEKASGAQPWQGMYTDLFAPIKFSDNKLVKMMVWSPKVTTITMKLENPANPAAPPSSGDNIAQNTVANQWELLTWDFSASPNPVPDDGDYRRVTLIFDIENIPANDVVYYFDNVQLDGEGCSLINSIFETPKVEALSIMPNPVTNLLTVDNLGQVSRLEIYNVFGRRLADIWVGNDSVARLDVSQLPAGMYILAGYTRDGLLKANAKFMKQ
ncbi:MAG: T9SS type A sorting domain-containing protein [Phaeodactylibacter sp.]|nr:T9SS type A sorting domain-containing protein [Phaeodactylibacter sp.]MCB9050409.1 T9SS type A sorting domain-containing protein [Lewinellaceae bacterium]